MIAAHKTNGKSSVWDKVVMDLQRNRLQSLPTHTNPNPAWVEEAMNSGSVRAKVVPVSAIALGHWIKLQCQYQCQYFCRRHTCPTLSPTSEEMSEILMDYRKGLFIEAETANDVHGLVLDLERRFKRQGYHKVFAMTALPCNLCDVCDMERPCRHPEMARPTLQACGIDVPQTLKNIGWAEPARFAPCGPNQPVGLLLMA